MKKNAQRNEKELANSSIRANRISEIRTLFCNGNNAEFAERLGVSKQYSSGLCTAGERITERTLEKILTTFPEVNRSWLYFGEGEMLIAEAAPKPRRNIAEPSSKDSTSDAQVSLLRDIIREKDEKIAELTTDIALLRQELRNLQYEKEGALAVPISTEMETSTI